MSKICLKLDLVFDSNEAWNNVDDFSSAFVSFLESQHLLGEKILNGNDSLNEFYLYIYKNPMEEMVPTPKPPTLKQQVAKVSTVRNERGQYAT